MSILCSTAQLPTSNPPPLSHPCLHFLELCRRPSEFSQAHSALTKLGLVHHPFIAARLMAALGSADAAYSRCLFDRDPNPNTYAYNAVIRCHTNAHQPDLALAIFHRMVREGRALPNSLTFPFVLKACSSLGAVEEGRQVHGLVCKNGLEADLFVRNSLILFYVSNGYLSIARMVFDRTQHRDVVSWNTMMAGLVNLGWIREAQAMFDEMPERNVVSWNCLIDGYVKCGLLETARGLFDRAPTKNRITWNTIINGYCSFDSMREARSLFDRMPPEMKDLTTFTMMIDMCARGDRYSEILDLFNEMLVRKAEPNTFTLVSVLTACSHLTAFEQGEWVHSYLKRNRIRLNAVIGTALLDMYAKCGKMYEALDVFNTMEERDVVAWNSIIVNLGIHGYGKAALRFFYKMLDIGMTPDEITFLSVLSACRHSGAVEEGWRCLYIMSRVYNVEPKAEHFGCMVDLFCRSGLLEVAKEFIEANDAKSSVPCWGALLAASGRLGDVEMGKYAAKRLLELDPHDTRSYVALSNMYARGGRWNDAAEIRKKMRSIGMEKLPGCSLIEVAGKVHEFSMGGGSSLFE